MTIEELLDDLWANGGEETKITKGIIKHGDDNNDADYSTLIFTIGSNTVTFKKIPDGWEKL